MSSNAATGVSGDPASKTHCTATPNVSVDTTGKMPVASATLLLLVMSWCVSSLFSDLVGIFEVP
jgi:hypothetical protein